MIAGHVRGVVVLYSNYCLGVVAWVDSTLAVLDEWSSYRGGRLSMFNYSQINLEQNMNMSSPK